MTLLLKFRDIKCERNGLPVVSLEKLDVQPGSVWGIMGENGAGKSTLLKALSLLEPPQKGKIYYKGNELSVKAPPLQVRREWASVFQHSHRFPGTVFENVEIGLKIRHVKRKERREKVMTWLERFRISHLADSNANTLSGGEAQRMNMARAFVLEPEVLFLDEPFSALDFPAKIALLDELQDILARTNTTAFLISHDLTDIEFLADHFLFIHNKEAALAGKLEDILRNPTAGLSEFLAPWRQARQHHTVYHPS